MEKIIEEVRPWGRWAILYQGPGYKVKKVEIKPGHRLSLQKHRKRSEHWILVSGKAKIICHEESFTLRPNESFTIPRGAVHRLANPGSTLLVIIEVQLGSYLGEDDIVRLEDDYNRVNSAVATSK